jgi:hypothetical protein
VSGRPADIRQRELKQAMIAAQKVGARQIQVNLPGGTSIVIPLPATGDKAAPDPADNNNSFDKIMKPGA